MVSLGAGTAAAADTKRFSASIAVTGSTFTLTITNLPSSSQDLGSADVTVPSGYTVTGFVSITAAGGAKVWSTPTLSGDGRTIYLRNPGPNSVNRLTPGPVARRRLHGLTHLRDRDVDVDGRGQAVERLQGQRERLHDQRGAAHDHGPAGSARPLHALARRTANRRNGVLGDRKAFDVCGTQKTNYAGGAVLGGLGNAPNGQAPSFGALAFSGGVATASVTPFLAGTSQTLTVADGSVSSSSNSFTVLPGALSSFAFGTVGTAQTAGVPFGVTVTARDAWLNVKTNYTGVATLSGNLSASTKGCGSGASSPCSPVYSALGFSAGIGSANVTAYSAETARSLSVTDGAVTAASNSFAVGPGPLTSFDFAPIATQNAGVAFTVTVTAADAYGNVKSDYAGSPALGGSLGSSASGCGTGGSSPCPPAYGTLSFVSGVGTASVTAFKAETARTLNAADGAVAGTSNQFDVVGGAVAEIAVGQQPTDTKFGTPIAPAITVLATDLYGNPSGATVTMAIGANPGAGTLSGTKTRSTVGGTATFADLSIDKTGIDYTLVASVGSITTTSEPFDIVTVVVGCTNHPNEPCVGSTGSDTNPQTPTNAEVFAPAGGNPGTLTITLLDFAGACPDGSGQAVVVNPPNGHGNDNPIQVKIEYDKTIAPGTGVANFVFCVEKLEGLVIEPVPACKDSAGTAQPFPCIDDRRRDNAGDLRVRFLITDDPIFHKR